MAVARRLANNTTETIGMSNCRWIGHLMPDGGADPAAAVTLSGALLIATVSQMSSESTPVSNNSTHRLL